MVQLQPNLHLTLKHLGPYGCVITAEHQAALDTSVIVKREEAGLKSLVLWGKILATNGKDYLIAEGYNTALYKDGRVIWDCKYYFSQDGVKWLDLVAVDELTASKASKIKAALTGDPGKIFDFEEKDPNAPPPPAEEGGEVEPPKPIITQVPELGLLRYRIDSINAMTGVIPVHAMLPDAHNNIVPNRLFTGVAYPDKLESYMHRTTVPGGPALAQDLRGSWCISYDPFKKIAVCKNIVYPGYTFYYDAHELTWGSLYVGDGVRNDDLLFML